MSITERDVPVQQRAPGAEPDYSPTGPRPPLRPRGSPVGRWIAAVIVAVLVVAGVGVSVAGHPFWTSRLGGGAGVGQDPQVAAVERVIQRADSEQSQALASGDPTVMSDTATAAYYRQLVQTNQQLVAQGATSIQLTDLTWGPVTVNATSASATSYETWLTTYSDGTTSESTDTNAYALIQQNGTWLIQADQQPTAQTSPTSTAPGQPAAPATPEAPSTPLPAISTSAATSQNWSGYAATSGTFTGVSGTWTVPQPSSSATTSGVGATWVGIGGVNSRDLIQAGTQDVSSGGQHQFQTWIEMLPQASQQLPLAVVPGDSVTVAITESSQASEGWQISMKNNTSGRTYQTTVQYQSSESSAEWIEEAPAATANGGATIVPLDTFGTISFSGATAVENGQTVDIAQVEAQSITMLNSRNQPLAVPSAIGTDGSSFTVTRTSAVSTPSAPGRGSGRRTGGAGGGAGVAP